MPHEQGRCACGKERHWPKNAQVGDKWKCYRCGRVTVLVAPGTPDASRTRTVKSHAKASGNSTYRDADTSSQTPQSRSSYSQQAAGGGGCLLILTISVVMAIALGAIF